MGLLLFIISVILSWILIPVFILYAIIRIKKFNLLSNYFTDIALSIDKVGNVIGAPIMNDLLIKKDAVKFYGNQNETISGVTGLNYINGKCTFIGILLSKTLDKIQKDHVENAAKNI